MFNNEKALRAQHIWSLFKTENFKAIENLLNKHDKWSTQLCQISFWKKEKKNGTKPFICILFYNDVVKLVIDTTTTLTTFNQIMNQYVTQTVDQLAE